MRKLLGILFIMIAMCSCVTSMQRKSMQIEQGMTKDNVLKIMGTPGNRQFDGGDEAWQYCSVALIGDTKYYIIWFHDSVVCGMTQYTEDNYPNNYYRNVDWREMPHYPEMRQGY